MPDFRRIGSLAEDQVAEYLINLGYTIVTRRYAVRGGEIDLIALDDDILVFVEVKYRKSEVKEPNAIVGRSKTERIAQAAHRYLLEMGNLERPSRLDLIVITPSGIEHYQDAGSAD